MDFCTCLLNSHSLSSMKDDAYIYNNVITCIFWCKLLVGRTHQNAFASKSFDR